VVTREEGDHSVRIALQEMKERRNDRDPRASIHRLFDNAGMPAIDQVVTVISFVRTGKYEDLSIR
jgi:hypothetical protein